MMTDELLTRHRINRVLNDAVYSGAFTFYLLEYDILSMAEMMYNRQWMGISLFYRHSTLLFILKWHEKYELYEVCAEIYRDILAYNASNPHGIIFPTK